MARKKNSSMIERLSGYGGVRDIKRDLQSSTTLAMNKETVAWNLLCVSNTKITDIITWDENGSVRLKPADEIPDEAMRAVKKIKINKDGSAEVELWDKVGVLRIMAKAAGLLDSPEQTDKPSVIGINIKAPEIIDDETGRDEGTTTGDYQEQEGSEGVD